MINNNDRIESISVISATGSTSSYNSSSSSNSSASSCSSSQMSSTPTNAGSLSSSQSSSPNSSLSLSNAASIRMTSSSNDPANYYRDVMLKQPNSNYDKIAYDFTNIMGDLTNVCGTLNILARQIDQIVHKIDDKFTFILEGLNHQNNQNNETPNSNQLQNNEFLNQSTQSVEVIKDFKKMNEKNMALLSNTVKQNAKNFESIDSLKHIRTQNLPNNNNNNFNSTSNGNNKTCIYSNCANQKQDLNKNHNRDGLDCASVNHNENQNSSQINKISQYKNNTSLSCDSQEKNGQKPLQNGVSRPVKTLTTQNNEGVLMNIIKSDQNTPRSNDYENMSNVKVESVRSMSDRKVLPCPKTNNERSDTYYRYNTLSNMESEKVIKQRNKFDYCSPNNPKTNPRTFDHQNYQQINHDINNINENPVRNTSSLRRCTRSKSQPAFNKDQYIFQNEFPPNTKNICPIITNNTINTNNFTQNSMFEFKSKDDSLILRNQENNLAESSFYEDQLDNELENISHSPVNTENSNLNETASSLSSSMKTFKPTTGEAADTLSSPTRKVAFEDTIKSKNKSRSGNGNHVSFNINNAIYSTRQEIPISIIKGTIPNQNVNPVVLGRLNGNPIQSSLKKSTTSSAITQNIEQKDESSSKLNRFFNSNSNKSNRSNDTKTTIL